VKLTHTRWNIVEIAESEVPDLLELLEEAGHTDWIHGKYYRDAFIRHGDDGGWCITTNEKHKHYKKIIAMLEKVRKAADYPDSGEVFYLIVQRS